MTDELRKQAEEACPYGYEAAAGWKRQIWVLGFHAGYTDRAEKGCPVCEKVGLTAAASGQSFEKVQGDICTVLAAWERCKWRQNDV